MLWQIKLWNLQIFIFNRGRIWRRCKNTAQISKTLQKNSKLFFFLFFASNRFWSLSSLINAFTRISVERSHPNLGQFIRQLVAKERKCFFSLFLCQEGCESSISATYFIFRWSLVATCHFHMCLQLFPILYKYLWLAFGKVSLPNSSDFKDMEWDSNLWPQQHLSISPGLSPTHLRYVYV